MEILTVYRGLQKDYRALQIVNNDGTVAAGTFTSASILSADVWEGQSQLSLFQPGVYWYTAGSTQTGYDQGQFGLSITGASTTDLNPAGEYYCLVTVTTGGVVSPVWEGRLKVLATPGTTSPSPPDLITYDYAEAYCSILGLTETQRDVIPYIIAAASMTVRRECFNRNFDLRTYTEAHDVSHAGDIRVLQVPIQIVTRCQGQPIPALSITNTSGTVQIAQAYFAYAGDFNGYGTNAQTVTGVTLNSVSNGVATSSTVLFTAGQTIASLATAINAVGGGWTAVADSVYGAWPATELDGGFIGQGCAAGQSAQFNILQDLPAGMYGLDNRRQGYIWVGRQSNIDAMRWGPGGYEMFGPQNGQYGRVKATYVGGESIIPSQAQLACAELVKWELVLAKTDMILESETAQEYSYKLSMKMLGAMPDNVRQMLSSFKVWRA